MYKLMILILFLIHISGCGRTGDLEPIKEKSELSATIIEILSK
jgi:predicted small lipoprotein YifL